MNRPRLSAVVPCNNEASVLPELYRRLSAACAAAAPDYELVFVNDGSSDDSWPLLASFGERDPHVVCVNLSRNHGHQLSLSAGLAICRGERILIMDADLQDPPELLGEMMTLMNEGADVVFGQREKRDGESLFKRATAYLFYRLLNLLSDQHIPEDAGDFRLITRRVLDAFNAMPENHRFVRGMISWVGFRQVALPYRRSPRLAGKTKYGITKMARFALDAVTSFSIKPLRLALYAGVLLSLLSFCLVISVVWAYLAGDTVRGWTSLVALVLLLAAVQFLFLGLIGEYLGRLYIESKRRPLYMVQEMIRGDGLAAAGVRSTSSGESRLPDE
jgi:polyisoprenyl-phosphate glycosyltransferase